VVTCEYSYRYVTVTTSDAPWWRQIQFNSLRVDDGQFAQQGSGLWSTLSQNRVQLPAIVIEASPSVERIPFRVGDYSAVVKQDVLCHVFAETAWDKKFLHDALTYQYQHRIIQFDKDAARAANRLPLDAYGSPNPSGFQYPDLVRPTGEGGFGVRTVSIQDARSFDQRGFSPLYHCTVRLKCQVDLP
jgi:hypothetical protein